MTSMRFAVKSFFFFGVASSTSSVSEAIVSSSLLSVDMIIPPFIFYTHYSVPVAV